MFVNLGPLHICCLGVFARKGQKWVINAMALYGGLTLGSVIPSAS